MCGMTGLLFSSTRKEKRREAQWVFAPLCFQSSTKSSKGAVGSLPSAHHPACADRGQELLESTEQSGWSRRWNTPCEASRQDSKSAESHWYRHAQSRHALPAS